MKGKLISIFLIFIMAVIIVGIYILSTNSEVFTTIKDIAQVKPQQYYGTAVDMSQILPESKHYVTNSKGEDLIDIASQLGMNTLRITNITSISDSVTPAYTHEQWAKVLDKMKTKNMYAVILVEGNAQDTKFHDLNLDDYYVNFVKNYIVTPHVCNFSNVLAIDIANEPLLNSSNLVQLKKASQEIKAAFPTTMITIGSWRTYSGEKDSAGQPVYNWHDPKEVRQIENIVDIDSVHIYGFDKPLNGPYPDPYTLTVGYLKEIRKYTNKPIFIEEFGSGNGDALTDQNTLGSKTLQQKAYEGVLKAMYDFRNKGVLGATSYVFYPRTEGAESWNIAKDNANTLLPAAYTFQNIH